MAIALPSHSADSDFDAAQALQRGIRLRCGVAMCIESHVRRGGLPPHLALLREGDRGQSYRLTVEGAGVEAIGSGPAGVRYAVETLLQLLDQRGRLRACEIEDAPDFEVRGVMLDISRGKVPTPDSLRALLDLCVRLKLNALMLYTEHTFRFRRHPTIGAGACPLDAQTFRELDRYAAARFVDLIPCLQSLGHMEHILKLPRYAQLAEGDAGWTISPSEPGTYELLRDLYDEFLPNFRSHFFNANCDEPYDLERGKSADRAKTLGAGGVYLEHLRRVRDLARVHGKRTMIWGDVVHAHPERIGEIDRDLVLLDWWYEADCDYDRVRAFADAGLEFFVCPGTSSWNSLFPRIENSCRNISRWADAGRRHGARGLLNTDWGDFGHYNLQGNSWYGYAWGAQESWSGEAEPRSFDRAFGRVFFDDPSGVPARLYRELGSIHDPGFSIPNGSALQTLFFDDLERAYFICAARRSALRRCEARLCRVRERIDASAPRFGDDRQTFRELLYAADASLLAVRKAQAGLSYVAWRRNPERWRAPARRALASELRSLAREHMVLGRTLRRLWMARSFASNFDLTRRRIARCARDLRRAARRLESNRPTQPPCREEITVRGVLQALRASIGADRSSPAPSRGTRERRSRRSSGSTNPRPSASARRRKGRPARRRRAGS
jgi:hypothetical protein